MATSALMRPGRALITTTREARKIASSMSWVTNSTVLRSRSQMPSSSLLHQRAGLVVECAERLVQQHDLGVVGERARNRRALLHAARQLLGVVVLEAGEADRSHALVRDLRGAAPRGMPRSRRPKPMLSAIVSQGNSV